MNKQEAKQMGRDHFASGKQCTPFDCREVDSSIFAAIRGTERPAKMYTTLRGAFNQGWEEAHVASWNA